MSLRDSILNELGDRDWHSGEQLGSRFNISRAAVWKHLKQLQRDGIEIEAEVVLKGTKVDGVYDSDPQVNKDAKRFKTLNYDQVLDMKLEVMDLTAICLCRDHNMPVRVFNMNKPGNLNKVLLGEQVGTLVEF